MRTVEELDRAVAILEQQRPGVGVAHRGTDEYELTPEGRIAVDKYLGRRLPWIFGGGLLAVIGVVVTVTTTTVGEHVDKRVTESMKTQVDFFSTEARLAAERARQADNEAKNKLAELEKAKDAASTSAKAASDALQEIGKSASLASQIVKQFDGTRDASEALGQEVARLQSQVAAIASNADAANRLISLMGQQEDAIRHAAVVAITSNASQSLTPIGAIVAWLGNSVPDGWLPCDGATLSATEYESLAMRFPAWVVNGSITLPDLRDRFLRGHEGTELGMPSGSDMVADLRTKEAGDHRHGVPPHTHPLPETTGSVARDGSDPKGHRYSVRDDNAGWTTDRHLAVDGGPSSQEGQHRHNLGGDTGQANLATEAGGSHMHEIAAFSVVPKHVKVRFLIRVK